MERIRDNIPIAIAAAASLALHLFILFPALGIYQGLLGGGAGEVPTAERSALEGDMRGALSDHPLSTNEREQRAAASARRALQERMRRERTLPAEVREDETRLGIDASDANTMNWIGYDEYRQHLAELAEFEQAAFRLEQASGSGGSAPSNLPPTDPTPTVAQSPDPSPLPLPASAAGSGATEATNLVTVPQPDPASATPASATTAAAEATGADPEKLQPPVPPEMPASPAPTDASTATNGDAPPTERSDDPQRPVESPDTPRTEPTDPVQPSPTTEPSPIEPVNPADGTKPVPPAKDPTQVDPSASPRTDPDDTPVGPVEKPTLPAPSGSSPSAPPRDSADPSATTVRPPTDAPVRDGAPTSDASNDARSERQQPDAPATPITSDGVQGGGVAGPQPVDGAISAPTLPSPAGASGDTVSRPGDLSDRESDPTSIIEVPEASWQNGRPLAAKGITLRPVRPRFTTLSKLDGIAQNPIGELVIGRDGVPQSARIVRTSGNRGVDDAIRAALFKWRASGAQLDRLKPGATVTIRLRLVMLVD